MMNRRHYVQCLVWFVLLSELSCLHGGLWLGIWAGDFGGPGSAVALSGYSISLMLG
jgi:hypothetical protein